MHGAVDIGMRKPELVFLHGFLGSPLDWEKTISHLPTHFSCQALDLASDFPKEPPTSSIVIGYSMGGRIALQMKPTKGLVLIGAHLGLKTNSERALRKQEEQQLLAHLRKDPIDFITWWYRQPLFSTLHIDATLLKRRHTIDFEQHAKLLERFALSEQSFYAPPKSALLLYGEHDKKYGTYYSAWPNARPIYDAGHAAHLENPKMTAQLIQHYIEEIYAQDGNGS